jgi:release factor glutamine methyltransferase
MRWREPRALDPGKVMTSAAAAMLAAALKEGAQRLAAKGLDNPHLDARVLLAHVLCVPSDTLRFCDGEFLTAEQTHAFDALLARRIAREPVAYILGRKEFWSLEFEVTPAVLIPRPDSETIVDAALAHCPERDRPYTVLDLGVGSGCLLLSFLRERPNARGIGVDSSAAALGVAARNATNLGLTGRVSFLLGDWAEGVTEKFDLVMSNPPYVREQEYLALDRDVHDHEPANALFAGPDGFAAYRRIVPALSGLLNPTGLAILEIGAGQAEAVIAMIAAHGLKPVETRQDLGGIARAIVACAGQV